MISNLRDGILAWTESGEFHVFHDACLSETPELKVGLPQLLLDDPDLDGVTAFAKQCDAPQESVDDIKARLRLWGFGKRTSGSHRKIYFIQVGTSGPIKIGYTSKPIKQRLASLQSANPKPLRLIATLDGDLFTETELHQRFQPHRGLGEWFDPDPDLIQFIMDMKDKI